MELINETIKLNKTRQKYEMYIIFYYMCLYDVWVYCM